MEASKIGKTYNSHAISAMSHVSKAIIPKGKMITLNAQELDHLLSSFLVSLTSLAIKAIGFQVNAVMSFFTFPMTMMYYSFMFVVDPFRMVKWARNLVIGMLLTMFSNFLDRVAPLLNGHRSLAKLLVRICWGFFWAIYVCLLLFGLLVLGFVIGGVTMRYVVEEPIQKTEILNFDYTKSSPVALVPIMSCPTMSCGVNCREKIKVEKYVGSRVIPPNHKLHLAVSLTLPESDYNRNLGIFQVRVEYISATGEVTASPSYPCMLQFKSHLLRYLETFIMSVPLLVGYSSESQTLEVNTRGFTEGNEPTSCVKVILEQRAEYKPAGTGIPELYSASLVLKSELSLMKRIIWYWRRTIFIWCSMGSFMMELLFVLGCCRPIIIPRARASHGSAKRNAHKNNVAMIKGK